MKLNFSKNYLFLLLCLLPVYCCKSKVQSDNTYEKINLYDNKNQISEHDSAGSGLPIFYNMYLSVELSSFFDTIGSAFNEDLLNNTYNINYYNTSSKKALNIGVYAVDLSYIRAFDNIDLSNKYFSTMQKLSEELGIPSEHLINTSERFEKNIDNRDSLISIANEVYVLTDKYLCENEQYASSAQIILGGWIEAMYIAFNVANESKSIGIYDRIAEQKYSLESLIELLNTYKDDEIITEYLKKLVELKNLFNGFRDYIDEILKKNTNGSIPNLKGIEANCVTLAKKIEELRTMITS